MNTTDRTRASPAHGALRATKALRDYALDPRKWRKLRLLARERLARGAHRLRGAPVSTGTDAAGRSPSDAAAVAAAPERRWSYRSEVSLAETLVAHESKRSRQDVRVGPGRLVTEFDYRVADLRGACMVTNTVTHRSVYDAAGRRLDRLSAGSAAAAGARLALPVTRTLEGAAVSAYGNLAMDGGNYGHWLIDGVARLALVERFHDLASFERVVVPPVRFDFHRDMIALFGFGPERTYELDALDCVRFERLVCTDAPRGAGSSVCPGWIIDAYRARTSAAFGLALAPVRGAAPDGARSRRGTPGPGGRRIYVSRRDAASRRYVNEDEIAAALERRGFETVELSEHDFENKARLFSEAACVIGTSGAGMMNCLFCDPDAAVVEIVPSVMTHYISASICSYVGCRHRPIRVDATSALSGLNPFYGDLHVDIGLLTRNLAEAGF